MTPKTTRKTILIILFTLALIAPEAAATADGWAQPAAPSPYFLVRASVASDGTQANSGSVSFGGWQSDPSLSADGRYIAFASFADNLVSGDTNLAWDVFVHDQQTGQTTRVSVASDGTQGNNPSASPSISGDGRYVAFESIASNLVATETPFNTPNVYLHDRQTGQTTRVSVPAYGPPNSGGGGLPVLSANGQYVAFVSVEANLVGDDSNEDGSCDSGCDLNFLPDVFVRDLSTNETRLVSVASNGEQANDHSYFRPSISENGRYVAFQSSASNLTAQDLNTLDDIFLHDRQTGATVCISVNAAGSTGNYGSSFPAISADGWYVAFASSATDLVSGDVNNCADIFVYDRGLNTLTLASRTYTGDLANLGSFRPSISRDGAAVAFMSDANNLVPRDTNGDGDIFVRDLQAGRTRRVSIAITGLEGNDTSAYPSLSSDGRYVAFGSAASNLVPGDTNAVWDAFVAPTTPYNIVNSTGDLPDLTPGDGLCDTGATIVRDSQVEPECTLRAAIQEANAQAGGHNIVFDIPGISGAPLISPASALPRSTSSLTVDGSTQPGAGRIELTGASAGAGARGLDFGVGSDSSTLKSLTVRGFKGDGLRSAEGVALTLLDVDAVDNCGWGLRAGGNVFIGVVGGKTVSQFTRLSRNGNGAGCQAGGLLDEGAAEETVIDARQLEASDNNGPGIMAWGDIQLERAYVQGNAGPGVYSELGTVSVQGLAAPPNDNRITDNLGYGIYAGGSCEFNLDRMGAIVEGALAVTDNANWGIFTKGGGVSLGVIGLDLSFPVSRRSQVDHNGHGAECWAWDFSSGTASGEEVSYCRGGGIASPGNIWVGNTQVADNNGPGLFARGGVHARAVHVLNNAGPGVYSHNGLVHLYDGGQADGYDNQVSGNLGFGIDSRGSQDDVAGMDNLGVFLQGAVAIQDNAAWGIYASDGGVSIGLLSEGFVIGERSQVNHNGHGAQCWDWEADDWPPGPGSLRTQCRGGGLASSNDTWVWNTEINDNAGPGLITRHGSGATDLRFVHIQDNLGPGVYGDQMIHVSGSMDAPFDNLVSGNADAGLASFGPLIVEGSLEVTGNDGPGLATLLAEGSISIGLKDGYVIPRLSRINDNGGGETCFAWAFTGDSALPTWTLEACCTGGIRGDLNAVAGGNVQINHNTGFGIVAGGVVELASAQVCYNSAGGIAAAGGISLEHLDLCQNGGHGVEAGVAGSRQSAWLAAASSGSSTIVDSSIHDNTGDGVRFNAGNVLIVSQTQLISNTAFGINNLALSGGLDARWNWWGDVGGPLTGDGVNGVVTDEPWLTQPLTLAVSPTHDPVLAPVGTLISTSIHVRDWSAPSGVITLTAHDARGWLASAAPITLTLGESGGVALLPILVPPGASLGALDPVTVTAAAGGGAMITRTFNIQAAAVADLTLEMDASQNQTYAGDRLVYTITVSNLGPDPASGIVLTDTLPLSVTLQSALPSQGTCAGTGVLRCELGTLDSGSVVTLTLDVALTAPGEIKNVAVATAGEYDPDVWDRLDWEITLIELPKIFLPLVRRN